LHFSPLHKNFGIDQFNLRDYIHCTSKEKFHRAGHDSSVFRFGKKMICFLIASRMFTVRAMRKTSSEWNTYRTRFLVKAKQLTEPVIFVDALGHEHCGRPGDYLVETSNGIRRVAPRKLFEDVYVPMAPPETNARDWTSTVRSRRLFS
jgi:hypothetical protein